MDFKPSTLAIRNPATIYIFLILMTIMGWSAYRNIPKEASPDIQIPMLIVSIPYPGSTPEDVEALIVHKVEQEFTGLDHLKKLSSTSTEGVGMLTLEFHLGTDIDEARARVREALDRVGPELPSDAMDPMINEINLSEMPIMIINISGPLGLLRLKDIAEDVKDKIEGIPGVLEVKRAGGLEREVRVDVDPNKLRYYSLDLNQVADTISRENNSMPAGNIQVGSLKYNIRIPGEITDPEELKEMVITAPEQVPIQVQDVAKVEFGFQEIQTLSRKNGQDSVSLSVSKRGGENLLDIADQIKAILAEQKEVYGDKISFVILNDQSERVRSLVSDLENNIYTGLIFVLLVLFFSMGWLNAIFIATAIPFSMLLSYVAMSWLGMTMNVVVLFSLILALGMLVDNAIVVTENIYRHLELGCTPVDAAIKGVGEIAVPVITSTITTLVAFLPLLFMPGIAGEFMGFMPKTLLITLTASLVVGLIFNPVLCATLMKKPHQPSGLALSFQNRTKGFIEAYERVLIWTLDRPKKILWGMLGLWFGLLLIYALAVVPFKGVEFFPNTEPGSTTIQVEMPFGTNLETSDKLIHDIEKILEPYYPYAEAVVANVGQSQGSNATAGSNTSHLSHITISFPDWKNRTRKPSEIIPEIREKLEVLTGATISMSQPQGGPPAGKPINLEIYGNDLKSLKEVSLEIQRRIKNIDGIVNLKDDYASNRAEIEIKLDRQKISRLGLSTMQISSMVRTAINGREVSSYRLNQEEFDIIVRLAPEYRQSIADIQNLYVKTPKGESVPLSELASIRTVASKGSIRHINSKMVITVSADTEGIPGPVGLKKVQDALEDYQPPKGIRLVYSGENESRSEMQAYLGKAFLIALFLIFLVLVAQFDSILLPFIIMTSVFFSLIGVFFGMIVHLSPISIMMGGVGIISLAGVVVNNAIVLIDCINQLRKEGMGVRQAVIQSGILRMRPVLLTAVTTVISLIPVTIGMDINFYRAGIISFGSESGEMWKPMARAVIYGLGFSTVLTLLVVPMLYELIENTRVKTIRKKDLYTELLLGHIDKHGWQALHPKHIDWTRINFRRLNPITWFRRKKNPSKDD